MTRDVYNKRKYHDRVTFSADLTGGDDTIFVVPTNSQLLITHVSLYVPAATPAVSVHISDVTPAGVISQLNIPHGAGVSDVIVWGLQMKILNELHVTGHTGVIISVEGEFI